MPRPEAPLVALLLANGTIAGLVGQRIDPAAREQGTDNVPCITYKRTGIARNQALAGPSFLPRAIVEIVCWALTMEEASTLADAVYDALDRWQDASSDPVITDTIPQDDWDEDFDGDDVFYVTQSFEVWWTPA